MGFDLSSLSVRVQAEKLDLASRSLWHSAMAWHRRQLLRSPEAMTLQSEHTVL